MDAILVYVALGLGAVNLLLLLWLLFRPGDLGHEVHEILCREDITERVLIKNPRIKDWVNGVIREYNAQMTRRNAPERQEPISTAEFNKLVNEAVEVVLDKVGKRYSASGQAERSILARHDNTPAVSMMYASSYNTEGNRFYSVSRTVVDDTIFVIKLSAPNAAAGNLTIAESAHDKVIQCRDYLHGACQVEGNGANIKIKKEGVVSLQGADWKIEVPLEVEFY